MNIMLNGDAIEIESASSLSRIVDLLNLQGKRYAIEVNEEIIPRSEHESHTLSDGDRVEVVQAIGGG